MMTCIVIKNLSLRELWNFFLMIFVLLAIVVLCGVLISTIFVCIFLFTVRCCSLASFLFKELPVSTSPVYVDIDIHCGVSDGFTLVIPSYRYARIIVCIDIRVLYFDKEEKMSEEFIGFY